MPADPAGSRPPPGAPFPRELLAGDTLVAARALLGARLVREATAPDAERREGRIVEVEAYVGEADQASHARMGPTGRNRVMYGPPGVAYVYLVYGMHHCLNIVTEPAGRPAAILVRAVEPVAGQASMRAAGSGSGHRHVPDERLCAGPGLVARAFSITRADTGLDLCDPRSALRLVAAPDVEPPPVIVAGPRVGIPYAGEPWTSIPWRFAVAGSPSVSRPIHPSS